MCKYGVLLLPSILTTKSIDPTAGLGAEAPADLYTQIGIFTLGIFIKPSYFDCQ